MLTNLHVKNLALIDEAEVEFGPGLNILTGETGAGKSILIGSINAALGKKISREMIRTGETSALVELVFETENPHVLELLKEMDLEAEEGQVIISRKITGSRSVCRINGEACNISQVKALASLLLDIHGQHEHQSLLYPDRQIAILDAFAGTEAATAKGEVRALYQEWKNVRKELSAYELDEEARKREAAFLTFEINEIDQAELKEGEDEALETAYRKMGHAKKIAESLQTVYAITGYGAENSAGEQVGRAIRELQQAAVYDDALSGPSQTLSDIDGLLNDFNREISAYLSELTFSEEEYYETEKRLDEINRLKAKYGKTMEEIAAYREEQQKKLEKLENFESCRAALQEQLQKTEQKLDAAAHNLSKIRRNYAKRLETQIIEGLRDLNFLHVAFEISFEKTKSYTENGTDAVEFLISTNPGEAIRPLAKVVSGGELSLGCAGVQMATRFVVTEECDADPRYKQAYLNAKKEDITIMHSPVGMPGRAIRNPFLTEREQEREKISHCYQCLKKCDKVSIPYCITTALARAADGDTDNALLFCGENAWRLDHMTTVPELMAELVGESLPDSKK